MPTYKKEVKGNSRDEIWKNAIYSLAVFRTTSRILREDKIREIWNYFLHDFGIIEKNNKNFDLFNFDYIDE